MSIGIRNCHRNPYRREARREVTVNVIVEETSLEQLCLKEVIAVKGSDDSQGQWTNTYDAS
jgi:hypothetical protein